MHASKSDLPQGTLDMLILQVVAHGPIHGYAIAQRIQQISRDVLQVPQGSLYPALHRLENRGLLQAEWKASDTGRDAKFYSLTAKGRGRLEDQTANWARLSEAIGLIGHRIRRRAMNWWQRWRNRDRLEAELDAELHDHVARQMADQVRDGVPPLEARRQVRARFGGVDQLARARRRQDGARVVARGRYPRTTVGSADGASSPGVKVRPSIGVSPMRSKVDVETYAL
jgi:PadR family transcriptional regulator PadR